MATKGSGLKSTSINGVKMYMVSSQQRSPASWILDDDYSKLSFLCANRSVCLHAKYGKHYTLQTPRSRDSWVVPNVLVNKLLMAWTGVPWEIIEGKTEWEREMTYNCRVFYRMGRDLEMNIAMEIEKLYEVKDERHAEAFWSHVSLADEDSLPLGEKAAAIGDNPQTSA
ncbi:hypothetical protein DKX38_008997 [Salix brachista]|uniref:Uncharacterized protein n=1 Tax=Salix brachista TaxID=2182728 RepID=A0A5N5MC73_9ROSI|nr:hypothetical protein DKX38_008997 [Salix brachista]